MIFRSSDAGSRRSKLTRLLLLAGAIMALVAIPAEVGSSHPGIVWQSAPSTPGGAGLGVGWSIVVESARS